MSVLLECADELLVAGETLELQVERPVSIAQLLLEGFEARRGLPAVDRHPPPTGLRRPEQGRADIPLALGKERRPGAGIAVSARKFDFASGRRSKFPDSQVGQEGRPRFARTAMRGLPSAVLCVAMVPRRGLEPTPPVTAVFRVFF